MSGFAVGSYVGPAGVRRLTFEAGLEKLKGKDSKKLENNTYLVKVDAETLGVKLHNTIVVYIFKSGNYQYDTGGWRTVTTKDRINRYGPARVHQENNIWYIGNGVFEDGVRLDSNGKVLSKLRVPDAVQKKKRKLDKLVRTYINGFADHVVKNGLKPGEKEQSEWDVVTLGERPKPLEPGPGDCWAGYFGLQKGEGGKVEDKLQEPLGVQHLLDHMTEEDGPYFVPSLLWKAITTAGYTNPSFIWHSIASDAVRGRTDFLKRVLTGYFRKRKPALLDLMD